MKRLLTFIALCLPIYLFAQGFGSFSHDQPFFAKDIAASAAPVPPWPGAAYWWVASDLTNSPVTEWNDRIIGQRLWQYSAGSKPTWDTNAVTFTGVEWFQSTNNIRLEGGTADPDCFAIVFQPDLDGITRDLIPSGSWGDGYISKHFSNQIRCNGANLGTFTGTKPIYVLYAGKTGSDRQIYTNGVFSILASVPSTGFSYVGKHPTDTGYWKGKLMELIIWTNTVYFDAATRGVIDNYFTNKYSLY